MAHGPPPKPPELRERRNKTTSSTTLVDRPDREVPEMPPHEGDWHPRAVVWWRRVWESPMASQYLEPDRDGLERLCDLVDELHKATSTSARTQLNAEIRLQEQRYGLSPQDRNRLQWAVQKPADAVPARPPEKRPDRIADPRSVLMAVK